MNTIDLNISGMTCDHCASTIEAVLLKVAGVDKVTVSYAEKLAQITVKPETDLKVETLIKTVEANGYRAESNDMPLLLVNREYPQTAQ